MFGRGAAADAVSTAGGPGFTLLTTARASAMLPGAGEAAAAVYEVGAGRVDELAGALLGPRLGSSPGPPAYRGGGRLLALGGGRVIDVAKALAAAARADGETVTVTAIPTTLSGAEMTTVHRHAAGVASDAPRVRPAIVVNDPALCASQPPAAMAASAANALGHLAEGPLTPLRHPVARAAALEGARALAAGCRAQAPGAAASGAPGEDTRDAGDALALGALLAGYVIGSTWYGLHHVCSQTVARFTPVGHSAANAILLPWTLRALRRRFPAELVDLDDALGAPAESFAERLAAASGVTRLRDGGVGEAELARCVEEAATRPELQMTPPAPDRDELTALYRAAH